MFLHHRLADTQSQSCAPAGAFRRVKRVEDVGQVFGRDSRAVVYKTDPGHVIATTQTNFERAFIPYLSNGLFSIEDEIEKDLHQPVWVARYQRQSRFRDEVHGDVAFSQGVSLQV